MCLFYNLHILGSAPALFSLDVRAYSLKALRFNPFVSIIMQHSSHTKKKKDYKNPHLPVPACGVMYHL